MSLNKSLNKFIEFIENMLDANESLEEFSELNSVCIKLLIKMGILRGSLCNILSGLVYLNKSKVRLEMSSEMERLGKLKGKSYI